MKATETNLLKFLQGTKQFIIPIYQRTYSWGLSDCQQLWNDILRVAQNDNIPAHFVGLIVYVEKGIYHISSITRIVSDRWSAALDHIGFVVSRHRRNARRV